MKQPKVTESAEAVESIKATEAAESVKTVQKIIAVKIALKFLKADYAAKDRPYRIVYNDLRPPVK